MLPSISSDSQFYLHLWKEANVHTLGKASHQLLCSSCCLLAAILHMLDAQWSMPWSPALCSSWCISVSFPICLCDPCSTSTCKVKSLLFWPTSDLITLGVVTDCSRLLFQAISSSVVTHSNSGKDKECLKLRKTENTSISMFCWWRKTRGKIPLSSLKHLEVWLSIIARHASLLPAEHQHSQLMVSGSSCGEFSQGNSTGSFSFYSKPEKLRVHSPNKSSLAKTLGRQGELISHWSVNLEVISLQGDTIWSSSEALKILWMWEPFGQESKLFM